MKFVKLPLMAAFVFALTASADETGGPTFGEPVRLEAGGKFLGEGRLYPSPAMFEAGGKSGVLVADLAGRVTVAFAAPEKAPKKLVAETPLLKADGKPLKFSNW